MEKILALDVGDRRIGVAVSDALGMFAHPRETLERNTRAEFAEIVNIARKEVISMVVIGLPLEMNGRVGLQAEKVLKFREKLEKKFVQEDLKNVQFVMWDERLTSVEAERYISGSGLTNGERKKEIDAKAAQIILEAFLASQRKGA